MAWFGKTKSGKKVVLRNPAEKGKRYARQLKSGTVAETGKALTDGEKAWRKGYLTARSDNAEAYNGKKRKELKTFNSNMKTGIENNRRILANPDVSPEIKKSLRADIARDEGIVKQYGAEIARLSKKKKRRKPDKRGNPVGGPKPAARAKQEQPLKDGVAAYMDYDEFIEDYNGYWDERRALEGPVEW